MHRTHIMSLRHKLGENADSSKYIFSDLRVGNRMPQGEKRWQEEMEDFRREVIMNEICLREGIKPHSYFVWTKEFIEVGKKPGL